MGTQLDDEEKQIINSILYVSASLSAIGALFIILTYLLFKETRTSGTKLIFFLSFTDLMCSLSWLPWNLDATLCIIQAVSLQFFEAASFMWTFCICVSLYQIIYQEKLDEEAKKMMPAYHILSWGYPAVSVIFCLIFDRFGPAGSWCWIKDPQDLFRLWVYGLIVFVLFAIIFTVIAVNLKLSSSPSEVKKGINKRVTLYLVAFVITQLPALINRTQNYFYPDDPQVALFVLQAVAQPSQGLCNCIVYGFNDTVFIEHYKYLFSKCYFACCNRKRHSKRSASEEIPIFDYDYASDEE